MPLLPPASATYINAYVNSTFTYEESMTYVHTYDLQVFHEFLCDHDPYLVYTVGLQDKI